MNPLLDYFMPVTSYSLYFYSSRIKPSFLSSYDLRKRSTEIQYPETPKSYFGKFVKYSDIVDALVWLPQKPTLIQGFKFKQLITKLKIIPVVECGKSAEKGSQEIMHYQMAATVGDVSLNPQGNSASYCKTIIALSRPWLLKIPI